MGRAPGTEQDVAREVAIPEPALQGRTLSRDAVYRRLLGLADVASAGMALSIGVSLLGDHDALNPLALLAIPMVLLVSKVSGLYDRDESKLRKETLNEIPDLLQVATLYTFLVWLAGDGIVEGTFGRDQAAAVWVLLFASMLVTRSLARLIARRTTPPERCVVLGDGSSAGFVARKLADCAGLKAELAGRVSFAQDAPGSNGIPVLGGFGALGEVIERERIERVVIAPSGSAGDEILDAVREAKSLGTKVSVMPSLFEVVGSSVEFDDIDGMTMLGIRRHGLTRSSAIIKRGFDLVGAGIGVLLLGPLLLMIALAIKLDTPGSVLFRQRRMGRGDQPFEMLKFRTMVDGAEADRDALQEHNEAGGGLFKIEADPRVTRVGRFLRRTSLDELPQLFNVLRGDMSLVGPRPLVIDEDALIEGWQRGRLVLPPGMTGMWQVFGSARIPLNEMVKIDYIYGANWSLWLDVKILMRTVAYVFSRRGL